MKRTLKHAALFLAQCHRVVCSDILNRPLSNTKLDQNIVPTGGFFVVRFPDDVRYAYAKNIPMKSQLKAIVDNFFKAGTNTSYLVL